MNQNKPFSNFDVWLKAIVFSTICFFFILMYGGASIASEFIPWFIEVDFPFEKNIPFYPSASILYLSLDFMVIAFLYRENWKKNIIDYELSLFFQTLMGAVFFVVLPVKTNFPVRVPEGSFTALFHLADLLNFERNFLPSLHVSYAVTTAFYWTKEKGMIHKTILGLWALSISISTMLIHEHHLLDVLSGFILAMISCMYVVRFELFKKIKELIMIESFSFILVIKFSLRHLRYLKISLILYFYSLFNGKKGNFLRHGFNFLQYLDDILDKDLFVSDPVATASFYQKQNLQQQFSDDPVGKLVKQFYKITPEDLKQKTIMNVDSIIDAMINDYKRRENETILSETELQNHHKKTFAHSTNLLLVLFDNNIDSGEQIPSFVHLMSWCSIFRDLKEDYEEHLYNIPKECLTSDIQLPLSYNEFIKSEIFKSWFNDELNKVESLIPKAQNEIDKFSSKVVKKILNIFMKDIIKYFNKFKNHGID